MEWLPISTAPKDGTVILIAMAGKSPDVAPAFWWPHDPPWVWRTFAHDADADSPIDGWMEGRPTHWMPLPSPPVFPVNDR